MPTTWQSQYVGFKPPLNINVCFWPHQILRQSLVQLKTMPYLRKELELSINFPVGHVAECTHIGQASWTLGQRLKEHKQ